MQLEVGDQEPWFIDSVCSTHMSGNLRDFISLQEYKGGKITFGNNIKCGISGIGTLRFSDKLIINNVNLVDNLSFKLLSVSQICANGKYQVVFDKIGCQ